VGGINFGRVVLGGLLAGLIINISECLLNGVVLARDMDEAMRRLNLPPVGGNAITIFVIFGFVLGIAAIWFYAAIRPRFGAGVKTALCRVGGVVLRLPLSEHCQAVLGFFPVGLITISIFWGLVEILLATASGAWLYTDVRQPA